MLMECCGESWRFQARSLTRRGHWRSEAMAQTPTPTPTPIPTPTPTCVTPPSGMLGWWPGDGNANDISGQGKNGMLVNGTGFAAGEIGQAFSFNGVNQNVHVNSSASIRGASTITACGFP